MGKFTSSVRPDRWVLASGNQHKLRELQEICKSHWPSAPFEILSASAIAQIAAPEETGQTFEENAWIKSRYYFDHTGLPCLADDSGLEVEALHGAPGIYSARFAGPAASDSENRNLLLSKLEGQTHRGARFVCCLSLSLRRGDEIVDFVGFGTIEGIITQREQGRGGFGYDPLFLLPSLNKTLAELTADEKNRISHRAMAFQDLRKKIEASLYPGRDSGTGI